MHVASASPRAQRAIDTDTKSLLKAGSLIRRSIDASWLAGPHGNLYEVVELCLDLSATSSYVRRRSPGSPPGPGGNGGGDLMNNGSHSTG